MVVVVVGCYYCYYYYVPLSEDPFRGSPHILVLAESYNAWDGQPAIGNTNLGSQISVVGPGRSCSRTARAKKSREKEWETGERQEESSWSCSSFHSYSHFNGQY